jgi:hypothetical protein
VKQSVLVPQFIESAPADLSEGVLYISDRFHTALHRCCCGCGVKVVTPLNQAGWSYSLLGDKVTLRPSIGNWSFPCKSHYLIIRNEVIWLTGMSDRQIRAVKARDARDQQALVARSNLAKIQSGLIQPADLQLGRRSRVQRWLAKVMEWWRSLTQ